MATAALISSSDNFIHSVNNTTNYGTAANLVIGNNNAAANEINRSLLKFDLSTIPSNAVISSAIITLTYQAAGNYLSSNNRTLRVYRQKRDWVEAQSTWTIWKTSNNWASAGGFNTADCEQTDIGTATLATTDAINSTKTITLTAAKVQEMIDGTFTNNGFLLKVDTEADDRYQFHSKEATESYRPKLDLVYTVPASSWFLFM